MPGSTRASFAVGVDRVQRVHVARVVKNHGHIHALAGQAGPCAARQHGRARLAAGGERSLNVAGIARKNDADGKLAIVRRV